MKQRGLTGDRGESLSSSSPLLSSSGHLGVGHCWTLGASWILLDPRCLVSLLTNHTVFVVKSGVAYQAPPASKCVRTRLAPANSRSFSHCLIVAQTQ